MSFWKQFDDFDPISGEIPFGSTRQLVSITSRARTLLRNRNHEELCDIANTTDLIIYNLSREEIVDLKMPHNEIKAAYNDFLRNTEDTIIDVDYLDTCEGDEIEISENDFFDSNFSIYGFEALKEFMEGKQFTDVLNYEVFAVLALWKVADSISWSKYPRDSLAADSGFEALEAICYAEHLHYIRQYESLLIDYKNKINAQEQTANNKIKYKVKEERTSQARQAAYERHKEHKMLKQDAIEYFGKHRDKFKSVEEAARNIAGVIVPVTHRTVVKWISEYKKLHSAS